MKLFKSQSFKKSNIFAIVIAIISFLAFSFGFYFTNFNKNLDSQVSSADVWYDSDSDYWTYYAASSYAGGIGTKEDPYLISTPEQLAKLSKDVNNNTESMSIWDVDRVYRYFKMTNDIDLAGHLWVPIGFNAYSYSGAENYRLFCDSFDGDFHSILNINVRMTNGDRAGLFGTSYGKIINLGIESGVISGSGIVGGIVATNYMGSIKNCWNNASVTGIEYEKHSSSWGNELGWVPVITYEKRSTTAGGIAGISSNSAEISNCCNYGDINSYGTAGGIVGCSDSSSNSLEICNSYNTGKVSAGESENDLIAGGLVGEARNNVEIKNSYNLGDVSARGEKESYAGGLIGATYDPWNIGVVSKITDCFSLSNVMATGNEAQSSQIIGKDTDGSIVKNAYGKESISDLANLLKEKNSYIFKTESNGALWTQPWDFNKTWEISRDVNSGYPTFKSNETTEVRDVQKVSSYSSGKGTEKSPYLISSEGELIKLLQDYYTDEKQPEGEDSEEEDDERVYYKLEQDYDLSGIEWTPVGTNGKPFTGVLDGNGHTISNINVNKFKVSYETADTLDWISSGDYQGLFGYISGAEIKNLKVSNIIFDIDKAPEANYFLGAIAGYATDGSIISCCEVELNKIETIKYKTTFGGIVGRLCGGSIIENSGVYGEESFILQNEIADSSLTIVVGGIVGSLIDSAKIQNGVSYIKLEVGDYFSEGNEDADDFTLQLGGISGYVSGSLTKIINGVRVGEVNSNFNGFLGAVVGCISNQAPEAGNIANIAFSQNINAFGSQGGYSYKTNMYVDRVVRLLEYHFTQGYVFFSREYPYELEANAEKNMLFVWNSKTTGWSDKLWVAGEKSNDNTLRLQMFQKFVVKVATVADINNLLKIKNLTPTGTTQGNSSTYKYGSIVKFEVKFRDDEQISPDDDFDFYVIEDILIDGESATWEFSENIDEATWESQGQNGSNNTSKVRVKKDNGNKKYIVAVETTGETSGEISFVVAPLTFVGKLHISGDVLGSSVKFQGGTGAERTFTKQSNDTAAIAKAGSLYAFDHWDLYKRSTKEVAEANGEYLLVDDEYWIKKSAIYSSYDLNMGSKYAPANLPITFGREQQNLLILNSGMTTNLCIKEDFLLEAVFDLDPYKFYFSRENQTAVKGIEKIVVDEKDLTESNNIATVGKSDNVTIHIYVLDGYSLDDEKFISNIQNSRGLPQIDSDVKTYDEGRVYSFTFNTSKLDTNKMDKSEHNRFNFQLSVIQGEKKEGNSNLGWIIGGSVAGGVVVIGLSIFLGIWFGGGRGPRSMGNEKKWTRKVKDDYKNFYL